MNRRHDKPAEARGHRAGSTEVRELFRCTRGEQVRIYNLRIVPGGAELWRITEILGQPPHALKEADLKNADEAMELLEEIGRALKAGGWREMAPD
jgi:hypothetical protein